jgi:O-antigen/teichoic acid export membrane protein
MSRKKYFLTGLASSYGLIGLNFLFTVLSVPLVLRYLTKEEFGVWALVVQFTGYLLLLDMGVSASVSRLLADHKDRKESPEYSQVFYSSFMISAAQALGLLALGGVVAWIAPALANVPDYLRPTFSLLLLLQAVFTAISLAFRALASPLWSHQRLDVSNLGNGLGLLMNFLGLWLGLKMGWGLYGMVWGTALGVIPGLIIPFWVCRKSGYYPRWEGWHKLKDADFGGLFRFSRDIFMLQLGSQMASATQIIVVSRFMSVESAATWAIATKVFTLGQQLCNRVMDASAGGLTEMYVRSERQRLVARFGQLVEITAWFSSVLGVLIVFFNSLFVFHWTGGSIVWPSQENIWLALLLFSTSVARSHLGMGGITKEMATLRWVQIVEALGMLVLAIFSVRFFGFSGVLAGSFFASAGVTLVASQYLNSRMLGISFFRMVAWIVPSWIFLLAGCLLGWIIGSNLPPGNALRDNPWNHILLVVFLILLSFSFCLRSEVRQEIFSRLFRKA